MTKQLPAPPTMPRDIPPEHEPLARLIIDAAKHHYDLAELRREETEEDRKAQNLVNQQFTQALHEITCRMEELGDTVKEIGKSQARLSTDLGLIRREFEALRKELAAVHGRVANQADDLHGLRERVDQIENELSSLKRELHSRFSNAATEPPSVGPR